MYISFLFYEHIKFKKWTKNLKFSLSKSISVESNEHIIIQLSNILISASAKLK